MSHGSDVVGIVGAGTMGSGIAQVAAMAGHQVIIHDDRPEVRESACDRIGAGLSILVEKNKLSESDRKKILQRIQPAADLRSLSPAGIVIEAIVERTQAKQELFAELGSLLAPGSLLATNTSSLSVTSLAASSRRPGLFVGMHFFNPAPVMELVEVVPALQTFNETTARAVELLRHWTKDPILVMDTPGFLVNRIARPFYGEALRIVEENLATPEEVDAAFSKWVRSNSWI